MCEKFKFEGSIASIGLEFDFPNCAYYASPRFSRVKEALN